MTSRKLRVVSGVDDGVLVVNEIKMASTQHCDWSRGSVLYMEFLLLPAVIFAVCFVSKALINPCETHAHTHTHTAKKYVIFNELKQLYRK